MCHVPRPDRESEESLKRGEGRQNPKNNGTMGGVLQEQTGQAGPFTFVWEVGGGKSQKRGHLNNTTKDEYTWMGRDRREGHSGQRKRVCSKYTETLLLFLTISSIF